MHILRSVRTYVFAALLMAIPATSFAGIAVSITLAPPALPVYTQPICPGDGYIWTPGYWAYGPAGYYWVQGAWVLAPQPGLLWTPGYWGFAGGAYVWHAGYWGPHVGFYGGVHYGFGYDGVGFVGGRWDHGHYFYNTAVSRVNVTVVHNVYRTTVVERPGPRASFNGHGGIEARPTHDQERWDHERHFERTSAQVEREHMASTHHENFASQNHGRPPAPAMSRPMTAHNVPHPPNAHPENPHTMGNPHSNMGMEQHPHNTNVPRPPNNGGVPHANNPHPQPHSPQMHNPEPHNTAMHGNPPHNNGGGHQGGNQHQGDHHEHH